MENIRIEYDSLHYGTQRVVTLWVYILSFIICLTVMFISPIFGLIFSWIVLLCFITYRTYVGDEGAVCVLFTFMGLAVFIMMVVLSCKAWLK